MLPSQLPTRPLMSISLLAALTACGEPPATSTAQPVRPAVLIEIATETTLRSIELPAVIEAAETADITFQVSGTLEELPVKAGDEISEGQVIGRLNQRDFVNAQETAQAQFNVADSQFQSAKRLIKSSSISRIEYEEFETKRSVALASLDSAQKALEDTVLRSPFAGMVATVDVDAFQNVTPSTPIVTIQTTGIAEAVVQIPARLVANSGRLQVTETQVILDAAPNDPVSAELYSTNTKADASNQTFTTSFRFTPPEEVMILPGMTGTLRAKFTVADNSGDTREVTVPLSAVLTEGDQQFVWLVDTDSMTVTKQAVVLEPGVGAMLAVREGLSPGDTIVGAGASYLFEGMTIRRYED